MLLLTSLQVRDACVGSYYYYGFRMKHRGDGSQTGGGVSLSSAQHGVTQGSRCRAFSIFNLTRCLWNRQEPKPRRVINHTWGWETLPRLTSCFCWWLNDGEVKADTAKIKFYRHRHRGRQQPWSRLHDMVTNSWFLPICFIIRDPIDK